MKNNDTFEKLREKGDIAVHLQIPLASGLVEESWVLWSASASSVALPPSWTLWKIQLYNNGRKSEEMQLISQYYENSLGHTLRNTNIEYNHNYIKIDK